MKGRELIMARGADPLILGADRESKTAVAFPRRAVARAVAEEEPEALDRKMIARRWEAAQ